MPIGRFQSPLMMPSGIKRYWGWFLFIILILAVWSWQVFDYGRKRAGFDVVASSEFESQMTSQVSALIKERDKLRANAAKFERSSQIDKRAADLVQNDLKILQQEKSELKQEMEFLKSLVSGDVTMLQLGELVLVKLDEKGRHAFSFTVSKRAKGGKKIRGSTIISIAGMQGDESIELKMPALGLKKTQLAMSFSFYQKFDGNFSLPEGFIPITFNVVVKSADKKFKLINRAFKWDVKAE